MATVIASVEQLALILIFSTTSLRFQAAVSILHILYVLRQQIVIFFAISDKIE